MGIYFVGLCHMLSCCCTGQLNTIRWLLTLNFIMMTFDAFVKRVEPEQAALVRAACSGSTLFAYGNMILH